MRRRRVLALALLPLLTLAACADDADEAPQEAEETDEPDDVEDPDGPDGEFDETGGPTEVEPAEVELLDEGEEPRRQLRLDLEEGTEIPATLSFEEEMIGAEVEGQEAPPQTGVIELLLTVTEVEDGNATVAFVYEDVTLDGQAPQEEDPLAGVEGELILDDRSRLVGTTQSAQGLDQLPVALPEEAVGVGATWEIRTEQVFDLPADEVLTVELVSLDGEEVELGLNSTTEGPDEPTEVPGGGMQPGAEMTLEELRREGTGQQRVSLREPFPVTASLATETLLVVSTDGETPDGTGPETGGEQRQEFREAIEFERR